ncbi:MAG: carbohydrate ABC transporter substrate-binding protein [Armatimonadetes bacterium]|nr:carbohydrate ABC transporter substrate-binding protein [Armatimonadota bacterium]
MLAGMFRRLSLLAILCLAAWALWPRGSEANPSPGSAGASSAKKRYLIRMAPGLYMPGRRPMDLGEPLKALTDLARAFEKQFPDTAIEFTEAPVGQREYLVTQLAAGTAPEILNVNVEDVWQDVQKGWYVVLDPYLDAPNPYIPKGDPGSEQWWDLFKYQAISRGKSAPDRKYYCITYDMVETGVFFNKTIFKRLGLAIPSTWPELVEIQERIKRAGIIPMLVPTAEYADWGTDLIFDQFYGPILEGIDVFKDPVREPYLEGYLDWDEIAFLNSKGYFTRRDPRFAAVFRVMKAWRKYFPKSLDADQNRLFITQKAAMWWNGSWTVNRLARDPDIDFEWGVFYLPPIPRSMNRFADGHEQVVIGGSGTQLEVTNSAFDDTGVPATSTKLKRTIAFLQFLTVPKNAEKVINEILAFLPNVKGATPRPELMPFDEILKRKYTTTKWMYTFDLRFNEIYRRMLELYINDGIKEDEFLDWMEANVRSACETVVRRKSIDLTAFESEWKRLAPLRAGMKELP